jgi:hypothetical protein
MRICRSSIGWPRSQARSSPSSSWCCSDRPRGAPRALGAISNLYVYQKAALFVEALQRTGRNLTRDSLLRSIESIKDWGPGWGLKYSDAGDKRRVMSRVGRPHGPSSSPQQQVARAKPPLGPAVIRFAEELWPRRPRPVSRKKHIGRV